MCQREFDHASPQRGRYRAAYPNMRIPETHISELGRHSACFYTSEWQKLTAHLVTITVSPVAFADVSKPAGVSTETIVEPSLSGVKCVNAVCAPASIVSDAACSFPIAGLLLCSDAVSETPGAAAGP